MYEYLFKDTTQKFSYETNRRLREHRRRVGFSLPYVAETLGLTETQLKDYEAGIKQVPPATLSKLGKLYNVSPGYFLGDIDIPRQKGISPSKYHTLF
jgi:hypothetical protein